MKQKRGDYMEHSSKFFCNRQCEYYPCHKGLEEVNCLFCYCPLYASMDCQGNYSIIEVNGRKVKDCSNCLFPHIPKNYDRIMERLAKF